MPDRFGDLRLLPDAETDVEDGNLLQHEPERAAEGSGESAECSCQHAL